MSTPERNASSHYDAIVIGAGSGGRGSAKRLTDGGMRVAMVEGELVGGECPFYACMPSKTLLRPAEVVSEAHHTPGVCDPATRWEEIRAYRDYMNSGLDDSKKAASYTERGIDVVRGWARVAGPGVVEIDDRRLEAERIVVATGSAADVPDIPGLANADFWTNREGTSFSQVPQSTIVLGGGPVGVELGQMLSRYGSTVTIVEAAGRLLAREHENVGERLAKTLASEGVEVRTGVQAERVETDSSVTRVHLSDGTAVQAERLLVAVGRQPRTNGIGLETVGVQYDGRGIKIDERCRAAPGVWAVGDVTGVAPFTHVAAYQSRIATGDILGRNVRADYRAIPRVVFSDPEVAAVGLTASQAEEDGIETVEAIVTLSELDRTETYGRGVEGELGILADAQRQVLVGAWSVGPLASEWIHMAVLAIKAEVPVAVLRDTIIQFPTFSEGMLTAVERLPI